MLKGERYSLTPSVVDFGCGLKRTYSVDTLRGVAIRLFSEYYSFALIVNERGNPARSMLSPIQRWLFWKPRQVHRAIVSLFSFHNPDSYIPGDWTISPWRMRYNWLRVLRVRYMSSKACNRTQLIYSQSEIGVAKTQNHRVEFPKSYLPEVLRTARSTSWSPPLLNIMILCGWTVHM